jgi:hypothetical protein
MGWNAITAEGNAANIPQYFASSHSMLLRGYKVNSSPQAYDESVLFSADNVFSQLYDMIASNPYEAAESFDPSDELEAAKEAISDVRTHVDTLDPIDDYDAMIEAAKAQWEDVSGEDDVEAEMDAYEDAADSDYYREVRRMVAMAVSFDAVDSSAYIMARHTLSAEKLRALRAFRGRLRLERQARRDNFLVGSASLMFEAQARKADLLRAAVMGTAEHHYKAILAFDSQYKQDQQYDTFEMTWGMDAFKDAASILAAGTGMAPIPRTPSPLQNAISSFMSVGTQAGMGIGQAFKSPGAGIIGGVGFGALAAVGSLIPAFSR